MNPCNPSPNGPTQESPDPTAAPHEENPTGIVSHRDRFSEPESVAEPIKASSAWTPGGLAGLLRRDPASVESRPQLRTLLATHIDSISAGLHGGVVLRGMGLFKRPFQLLVHGIRSITFVPEIRETTLKQVSLHQVAKDLLGEPLDEQTWNVHLGEVVLPVFREMVSTWVGASSQAVANPVEQFVFGPGGILNGSLDQTVILERLTRLGEDRIVPLLDEYKGPALVIVYLA